MAFWHNQYTILILGESNKLRQNSGGCAVGFGNAGKRIRVRVILRYPRRTQPFEAVANEFVRAFHARSIGSAVFV